MSIIGAYSSHFIYKEVYHKDEKYVPQCFVNGKDSLFLGKSCFGNILIKKQKKISRRNLRVEAWPDLSRPEKVDLEPIHDSEHLDRILVHAQQNSDLVIIDWLALWCRKCIYLKPKLETLAAQFDTKAKFYFVDVNKVPQSLVKRGNISKMPTIQLWKDGEMKAEVIGGHQGWLVIKEVREMIEDYL